MHPVAIPEELVVPHDVPPSKLYCNVNPATADGELVTVNAAVQVLVADKVGVAGVAG